MDKFKDAANQASKGMGMNTGMGVGDQAAYQQRAMKLNQAGVNHPAVLKSFRETGNSDMGGSKEIEFDVEVQPAGGSPYAATFAQFMPAGSENNLNEGGTITVRVAPDDPSSMLYWGG